MAVASERPPRRVKSTQEATVLEEKAQVEAVRGKEMKGQAVKEEGKATKGGGRGQRGTGRGCCGGSD